MRISSSSAWFALPTASSDPQVQSAVVRSAVEPSGGWTWRHQGDPRKHFDYESLFARSAHLARLHDAIQRAMGWTNSHLYQFEINGQEFTDLETWEPFDDDEEPGDTELVRLRDLHLKEGSCFTYLYDFGDYWLHDVVVEDVIPIPKGERLPRCTAGARACPPEDCGGPHGYFELLEALGDPGHPEHESYRVWVGGAFDPEAFDLRQAHRRL